MYNPAMEKDDSTVQHNSVKVFMKTQVLLYAFCIQQTSLIFPKILTLGMIYIGEQIHFGFNGLDIQKCTLQLAFQFTTHSLSLITAELKVTGNPHLKI